MTNGYRLKQGIENYFVEFARCSIAVYDPEYSDWYAYYEANVMSKGKEGLILEDKICIPVYGDAPLVLPDRDENRIINLNYSHLVEKPSENALYAYVPFSLTDETNIYEAPTDYVKHKFLSDWFRRWDMGGDQLIGIIPKYYETNIELYPLVMSGEHVKNGFLLHTDHMLFVMCGPKKENDVKMSLEYKGDKIEFTLAKEDDELHNAPERGDVVAYKKG